MANSTHTHEMQTTQTKDFDFRFSQDNVIASYLASYQECAQTAAQSESSDREALRMFHEEFKTLVLAANHADLEHADWEAAQLLTMIEPHEIEWLNWLADDVAPVAVPSERPSVAPRQAIKLHAGPRGGTPPPTEIWVVKVVGALICLNLLFAGLIVSELKMSDWLKWLQT